MSRSASWVGSAARRVFRVPAQAWHWVFSLWRRSIQLRVVVTTLVGSAVVVVVLGLLAMNQISRGLVNAERNQAMQQVETGQSYAMNQLDTLGGPSDPALDSTLRSVVTNLAERGGQAGRAAVVIQTNNARLPSLYVAQQDPEQVRIPEKLTRLIADEKVLAYQYVKTTLDDGPERPFLIVGVPVDSTAGPFTLYYFFPLDEQVDAVDVVRKTLIGMGVLLVLLLVGIAWLVTRQVVTPVRLAARTAERLSAGLLEERMSLKGEDDLARLAHSFNQMASNLQRQIVQLEEMSRLQRRFTSDVSHELRTPLTTIRMAADILHEGREKFGPDMARSVELLTNQLDRFESLLADLLEISRYDGGFAVLDAEVTDMGALITRVLSGFTCLADRNDVELVPVLPEPAVVAEVDARRVERVLRNLVGNAVEYGAGGIVRITVAADREALAVTVRDYGPGFRSTDSEAVFNRFWRADPSRARHTGGTGLGLSIAREDARLHGGWLQAWSTEGAGAQFRLTLPLRPGRQVQSSPLELIPDDAQQSTGGGS
ncbi:MAG: HAMP domain-containing histidine kinase [Corynebacteriales bacterium]|nr:HAMP domain-containing histidine kinase [Mycobacteriales bacterium]